MVVPFEHEINKHPVLNIYMDATDSTEYITNCVGSMNIHILLVKILLTFGFIRKPYKQHILKGRNVLCLIKLKTSLVLHPILLNG